MSDYKTEALPLLNTGAVVTGTVATHQVDIGKDAHMNLRVIDGSPEIPFCEANVRTGYEYEDLKKLVNGADDIENNGCWWLPSIACFCIPICCNAVLIDSGDLGLALDNGRPQIITPGWHFLLRPFTSLTRKQKMPGDIIQHGQVTIVRINQGQLGMAYHNSQPRLLLPGLHVYNSPAFQYQQTVNITDTFISLGPVSIFTVASGTVRVCYDNGVVRIYEAGRYAVNSPTFVVGGTINIQQQNLRFSEHRVLLDGGINLLVEGLLTFQVMDVAKLITQLGEQDLQRAITDTAKAELARIFAGIHLEQISTAEIRNNEMKRGEQMGQTSLLGNSDSVVVQVHEEGAESTTRSWICSQVIKDIGPIAQGWGVRIINFQLESTKIADVRYAQEYEEASLAMAKAKANRRAVDAQNDIKIQQANANARALQIEAEARKMATIKDAEARAESQLVEAKAAAAARNIEASARNEAAAAMKEEFARQLALVDRQVGIAQALKATTLVISNDTGIARSILTPIGPGRS